MRGFNMQFNTYNSIHLPRPDNNGFSSISNVWLLETACFTFNIARALEYMHFRWKWIRIKNERTQKRNQRIGERQKWNGECSLYTETLWLTYFIYCELVPLTQHIWNGHHPLRCTSIAEITCIAFRCRMTFGHWIIGIRMCVHFKHHLILPIMASAIDWMCSITHACIQCIITVSERILCRLMVHCLHFNWIIQLSCSPFNASDTLNRK